MRPSRSGTGKPGVGHVLSLLRRARDKDSCDFLRVLIRRVCRGLFCPGAFCVRRVLIIFVFVRRCGARGGRKTEIIGDNLFYSN